MTSSLSSRRGSAKAAHAPHTLVEQYLVFVVSGSDLAVALARVAEIVPYERVSRVPGTPRYVRGVVHLRGRVVPVIDIAEKLGLVAESSNKRSCILMLDLVLDGAHVAMGVVVDGVARLLDVDRALIQPPPNFGSGVEVSFLEGLFHTEGKMLPLLDVSRVFGVDELRRVASLTSPPGTPQKFSDTLDVEPCEVETRGSVRTKHGDEPG